MPPYKNDGKNSTWHHTNQEITEVKKRNQQSMSAGFAIGSLKTWFPF
jgi:hypothetical protein